MPTLNDWLETLRPERLKVIREDKWMLAENAFQAGMELMEQQNKQLQEQIAQLNQQLGETKPSAARWDGLINCARIRVLGSAGLEGDLNPYGNPHGNYGHLGLELWTESKDGVSDEASKEWLTKFADKAILANLEKASIESLK